MQTNPTQSHEAKLDKAVNDAAADAAKDAARVAQELPPLGVSAGRGVNKKAIIFLGVVALLGLAVSIWLFSKAAPSEQKNKQLEEVVVVPERKLPEPKPMPNNEAIPLASDKTQTVASSNIATDPNPTKQLTLSERRSQSGSVYVEQTAASSGEPAQNAAAGKSSSSSTNGGFSTINEESGRRLILLRAQNSGVLGDGAQTPTVKAGSTSGPPASSAANGPDIDAIMAASLKSNEALLASAKASGLFPNAVSNKPPVDDMPSYKNRGADKPSVFPVRVARNIPLSPDYFIPQGSAIRCLMNTRLISDISGQVVCTVTENILSFSAKKILVPKGTRAIGEYNRSVMESLDRVGIVWNRLITPDNIDISIDSEGTDPLGAAGVAGIVDEKWRYRLGAAVMVSLGVDLLKVAVFRYGPKTTTIELDPLTGKRTEKQEVFDSETVKNVSAIPKASLAQVLGATPSIIINQGTLVSIQTTKDLDFTTVYETSNDKR
jgi:type IV secretory pathway VirB10-like protein